MSLFRFLPDQAYENDPCSIAYSHWVDGTLDDKTKTWRIYYRCDDIWVLDGEERKGGTWKLQYSKVYNLGYGAETPYFGGGGD